MQTGWYLFDKNTGAEKLWIIWSEKPLTELDAIFKNAASSDLTITDAAQITTVRDFLVKHGATKPQVEADRALQQTVIKGTGDVLVSLLNLSHNAY